MSSERDALLLEKIVQYCDEIKESCSFFGESKEAFVNSHLFRNACGMCLIQIGEFAGRLSSETQSAIPHIPWKVIRDNRNFFAHDYGAMSINRTWNTLIEDIPILRDACVSYLEKVKK